MILFLMNFDIFDVFENCDKKRCFNSVFRNVVVEKMSCGLLCRFNTKKCRASWSGKVPSLEDPPKFHNP